MNQDYGVDQVNQKGEAWYQKSSLGQLTYTRGEVENTYLATFHKDRVHHLRKNLEEDTWVPADIPFDYYEVLFYLLGMEKQDVSQDNELDESTILNTSVLHQHNTLQQLVQNGVFKIVKNELHMVESNERFKLTKAFLYFLMAVYDYTQVFEFHTDHVPKFHELTKVYNSYSTQLILGAGAIHFGKLKTIAAKNMAISSLCLRFFLRLLDPLQKRIIDKLPTPQSQ